MSQKSEKYARETQRRMDELEQLAQEIRMEQSHQRVRLCGVEDGVTEVSLRERREARRIAREQRAARRAMAWLGSAALLGAAAVAGIAAGDRAAARAQREEASSVCVLQAAETEEERREEPWESEKIEAALLKSGYLSEKIPLAYDLQTVMRAACEEFACPYALALAVSETESGFDTDAVGTAGEVGIMQLLPGVDGRYHEELATATGQDPNTPSGNIVCGVYLLGKYMTKYGDPARVAMAYSMGESGAKNAWAQGVVSTEYSDTVLAAMEAWECALN